MSHILSSFSLEAIGTHWEIDIFFETSKVNFLAQIIKNRIEEFDKNYSRFRSDSLVSKISKKAGNYSMPADFNSLYKTYKNIYHKTHGLFTPLIGNALESLGYDASYSLKTKKAVSPSLLENTLSFEKGILTVKVPVMLDFGAGGKGYLVDIIGKLLKEKGVSEFLINAGGDMLQYSAIQNKARIGLENPQNTTQVVGVCDVLNESICGSAGNRRKWGKYHHIINPQTLTSPTNISAVWVTAKTACIADCMTTVLYLDQSDVSKTIYPCEYFILYSDMTFEKSKGFNAELFIE